MDMMMRATAYGEVGRDTEASPGNGQFYVRLYDGSYDVVGFDSVEEAWQELVDILDIVRYNTHIATKERQ